ncbi:MAG: IS30 family transposase [Candidatus Gracilibacteria bacterium]|nr:IS30 family transposase [Candidatus Gracilibacteria bacterium]
MKKGIQQLSEGEIYEIRILLKEGSSIPKTALKVGRNKTTIYRLLGNNDVKYNETKYRYTGGKGGITENKEEYLRKEGKRKIQFSARTVFLKRVLRRSEASVRYCRIEKGSALEDYIHKRVKEYYSPEQISGRWALMTDERLSKDTIYSYIYNTHPELIKKFFRRKGKKYQHKRRQKYQLDNRRMIDKRPKSIEKRTTLGHWESDTVVGKRKTVTKKCILTHVERKSGFLIARVLPNAQAGILAEATIKAFQGFPKYKKKSMIFDNGREFANHYDIERELNITTYFAHPYCSWERGTNEITNGLLRQFLPKGTDFEFLEEKELQKYVALINNRPRERLGFLTSNDVFNNKTKSCIGL